MIGTKVHFSLLIWVMVIKVIRHITTLRISNRSNFRIYLSNSWHFCGKLEKLYVHFLYCFLSEI